LLLLSAFLGYEAVYPWQLIDTLKRANGEEANLARVAYKRLGRVPFRGGQATRLWDDYNLRRARWAIDLDQQANRHQDAYRAAESAHVESSRSPDFRRESGAVFSEFFERRAIRAAFAEQRDESILWWLKALTVLPGRPELRRAVSQLVDPEYKRLVRTIRTGTLTRPNPYSTDPTFAQLSQDGRLVVTLAEDGIVRVWNLDGEVAIPVVLRRRVSRVSALAIRPDGKLLVVGQDNGAALLWRLDQPTAEPEELKSNKGQIARLVFGPDDKHLVITYFASGAALLWRADRPSEHPTELRGTYGSNTAVAFSRDGAQIMIVGNTSFDSGQALGTPRIWRIDKPGSDPVVFRPQKGGVDAVAFSPDGAQFVTLGSDRPTVRFWQLNQPAAEPVDKTEGVCGSVQPAGGSIALSPDASSFITTTISFLSPPGALLWRFDRPSGSPASLRGHEGFNVDDAFPPNGSRIVTADAAFSPDGSRIVTAGDDGGVQIWQSRDPDAVPVRVAGSAAPVDQVAFNRDGVRLASLERDGTARVWNVSRLIPPPQAFVDHGDAIRSVAISPDGSHLVTIGEHGVVCLWKIDEPDAKQVALGDRSRAWIAVAFSPDSARLAISDPERNVRIQRVDKPTDRAIASMATKSSVSAVAFSADGTRLAAACVDGNIYIWRLDGSAADPLILKGSGGVYEPPVFSPDGTRLVTVQRWVTRIWQIGRPGASPGEPTELAGDFDVV
ncbi:MAG TPA: WD40 repeat domain-containing protein, partial [Isosphaeraceae bacterium]|nr:WD40 repeat domain-containing protein [Isosphaeraceae bacterium]